MAIQITQHARAYLAETKVFDTTCATPQVLEHIASKWVILIIYALSQGTKRYSQLQQQIKGVSPKMLITKFAEAGSLWTGSTGCASSCASASRLLAHTIR